jgi:hypothetical protein
LPSKEVKLAVIITLYASKSARNCSGSVWRCLADYYVLLVLWLEKMPANY